MSAENVRRYYNRADNAEQDQKKGGRIAAYTIVIALLLLLIAFLVYHFVFVVRETESAGSEHYSAEQILKSAGIPSRVFLFMNSRITEY